MVLLLVCSWFPCLANTEGPVKAQNLQSQNALLLSKLRWHHRRRLPHRHQDRNQNITFSLSHYHQVAIVFFGFYFEGGSIQFEFQQFCVCLIITIFIFACLSCAWLSSRGRYGRNERGRRDNGGLQMHLNTKNRAGHDLRCGTLQGSSRSYDHNESWHRNIHLLGSHRSPV